MNIIDAYHELGSYRAGALLCGTTDKTVRRVVERQEAGGPCTRRPRLPTIRNTDPVLSVLAKKVKDTDGRISAKRLLPVARAAGYTGSARNLRRAVAKIKTEHRQKRRLYRPWFPSLMRDAGAGTELTLADVPPLDGTPPPLPWGRILAPLAPSLGPPARPGLGMPQEEVTRAGLQVVRAWRYARWIDGRQLSWVGRRVRPRNLSTPLRHTALEITESSSPPPAVC